MGSSECRLGKTRGSCICTCGHAGCLSTKFTGANATFPIVILNAGASRCDVLILRGKDKSIQHLHLKLCSRKFLDGLLVVLHKFVREDQYTSRSSRHFKKSPEDIDQAESFATSILNELWDRIVSPVFTELGLKVQKLYIFSTSFHSASCLACTRTTKIVVVSDRPILAVTSSCCWKVHRSAAMQRHGFCCIFLFTRFQCPKICKKSVSPLYNSQHSWHLSDSRRKLFSSPTCCAGIESHRANGYIEARLYIHIAHRRACHRP